jgi:hypothetical protein
LQINIKDIVGGVVFVLVGVFACLYSYSKLEIGIAVRMGPGYFPFLLGLLLIALGASIALSSMFKERSRVGNVPWRAIALITVAPVAFALTAERLGLLLATAIACLVASFASRETPLLKRMLITLSLTALCLLVFSAGLQISVPLLGTWLT